MNQNEIPLNSNSKEKFSVDYLDCTGFQNMNMHCHKYSELLFIIQGNLNFLIEDKIYHSDSECLIFFKEKQLHTTDVNPDERYIRYNLSFNYKYLNDILDYELVRDLYESESKVIPLSPKECSEMQEIANYLYHCMNTANADLYLSEMSRHLICAFLIKTNMLIRQKKNLPSYKANTYINRILEYILQNITEKLVVEELAEVFYVSRSKLMTDFKKTTGITIGEFILYHRLKLSKQLLLSGCSVNETAVKSGFVNTSHFIRTFKKATGLTPLQYCRNN